MPAMMRPIGPGSNMVPPSKHPVFPSLCPDFMKGVCSAFQCPKNHPEASLLFCQGYQRDCCHLGQSCTYMHATVEEEQYYKDTGLIPLRFMNKPIRIERGKGPLPNGQPSLFPAESATAAPIPVPEPQQYTSPEPAEVPGTKRKVPYEELEAEKNMLAEKVRILEKKVEQLDATNELLLEKNAKLRKRSPEGRRRSPDHRRRGGGRGRSRSRSKERGRSKDMDGGWKDRGGRQWDNNNAQQYNNNGPNNFNNRPM